MNIHCFRDARPRRRRRRRRRVSHCNINFERAARERERGPPPRGFSVPSPPRHYFTSVLVAEARCVEAS